MIKTKLEGVAEKETKKLLTLKKVTNMKKVFFAAIAAIVMVSVSNALASKNINANSDPQPVPSQLIPHQLKTNKDKCQNSEQVRKSLQAISCWLLS